MSSRLSRLAARLAVAGFPRRFRRRHGNDLLDTYRDAYSAATSRRARTRLTFELFLQGWLARAESRARSRRRPVVDIPPSRSRTVDHLAQDIRFGLRSLAASPVVTLVIVSTLALGVGANVAIFAVINAVLLRPLPIPEPSRVLQVYSMQEARGIDRSNVALPNLEDLVKRSEHIEVGGAYTVRNRSLSAGEYPERVQAAFTAGELFTTLRIPLLRGRAFVSGDGEPGAESVVIVPEGFWRQRLGATADVLERTLRIDGESHRIVGVVENTRVLPADLFLPLPRSEVATARTNHFLEGIVRLREGSSLEAARQEAAAIAAGLATAHPDTNAGWGFRLESFHRSLVEDTRAPLAFLLATVAVVLLIACSNVTHVLLARATTRGREIAVRTALGAGRARIVRQMLTESLLLALAGGTVGIALAAIAMQALRSRLPASLPGAQDAAIDPAVMAFTLAVVLTTGIAFGLAPAFQAARSDLMVALRSGDSHSGRGTFRRALVVAEVSMAVALLVVAALLVDGLIRAVRADLGFETEGRLIMRINPPYDRYPPSALQPFLDDVQRDLSRVPGVASVAVTSQIPLSPSRVFRGYKVDGDPDPPIEDAEFANWISVTAGYFETFGLRMRAGRTFTTEDDASGPPTVILNESMARRLFGDELAIGRRVHIWTDEERAREVVGVVADVTDRPLADAEPPQFFTPLAQAYANRLTLVVHADTDRAGLVRAVRDILHAIDPDLPVFGVQSIDEVLARSIEAPRVATTLVTLFAALALALALLGLYGVVSYSVSRRTHELGVRMALGAGAGRVRAIVVRDALRLALWGTVLGVGGSLLVVGFLVSIVPGLPSFDPAAALVAILLVLSTTLVAGYGPARRATRIDPLDALRAE